MFDCSGTYGDFIFLFHFSEIFLDLFFKRQKVLFYNIPDFFVSIRRSTYFSLYK